MKKSKKAALLLTVMGINSLPLAMDNSLAGGGALWSINRAEAAEMYPTIHLGQVAIGEYYPGGGSTDGGYYAGDYKADLSVKWNPSANRYGVYYDAPENRTHYGRICKDIYNEQQDIKAEYMESELTHMTSYIGDDNSIKTGGKEVEAFTIAKMLNANIQSGVFINEEKVKSMLKEAGIDASGSVIDVKKPMNTRDINADGKITTTGDIEAGGDATVHGSETIDHNLTVKGDETINGNETVGGDSRIKGNETVDGKLGVKGDTVIGDDKNADKFDVYAQTHLHGDTTVGDDANDKFVVNATSEFKSNTTFEKDVLVKGNSTLGDSDKDTLTVNATSEFKADATFDKNVKIGGDEEIGGNSRVHGSSEVDGDQTVHGSENVSKDLTVQGSSDLKGNVRMEKDLQVDGNTQLGNDKSKDAVDVYAKTNLHGDTAIGDSDSDKMMVNSTSEFNADAAFNKDIHVKGNAEVDKDLRIHGNIITEGDHVIEGDTYMVGDSRIRGNETVDEDLTVGGNSHLVGDLVLDGQFFAKGAAEFGDNVSIAKNLTVGGDAKIDGDVYGKSFNIGNEKYIDKDGINANNHKIRNVADGDIGPNSLDAVNGRQLWHTREALQHNINQVGAGAAAMASLHPLDYEHDDKLSVSAAMGNYKDKTAMAVGAFYRPNIKSMINLSGTLGYGDNMFGIGVTTKMGKVTEADTMTDEQLRDKVSEIHDENKELREENGKLKAEIAKSNERDTAQENQIAALVAKNVDLEKRLSDVNKAYNLIVSKDSNIESAYSQLISKVDSMAAELASLKADSQK